MISRNIPASTRLAYQSGLLPTGMEIVQAAQEDPAACATIDTVNEYHRKQASLKSIRESKDFQTEVKAFRDRLVSLCSSLLHHQLITAASQGGVPTTKDHPRQKVGTRTSRKTSQWIQSSTPSPNAR